MKKQIIEVAGDSYEDPMSILLEGLENSLGKKADGQVAVYILEPEPPTGLYFACLEPFTMEDVKNSWEEGCVCNTSH